MLNKGFNPQGSLTDAGYFGGLKNFQAATGVQLYVGQLLKLVSGRVTPVEDDDDATAVEIVGVAAGFFYIDSSGQPTEAKEIPSALTSAAGFYDGIEFAAASGAGVRVSASPDQLFAIRATTAVASTSQGATVTLTDNLTGEAKVVVGGTPGVDVIGKIVDVVRTEGPLEWGNGTTPVENTWGAANTIVLVKLTQTAFG